MEARVEKLIEESVWMPMIFEAPTAALPYRCTIPSENEIKRITGPFDFPREITFLNGSRRLLRFADYVDLFLASHRKLLYQQRAGYVPDAEVIRSLSTYYGKGTEPDFKRS